jgi:hypothetical protein
MFISTDGVYMGSYSASRTGLTTWRIREVTYSEGKRKIQQVPREAYIALGINPSWTLEEAQKRCHQINADQTLNKKSITAAASRVKLETIIESTYIPEELATSFVEELKTNATVGNDKKILFHWQFAQKLIVHLKREPSEYADSGKQIYRYFQEKKISLSYCEKVLAVLNQWGKFVSRKQRSYFEPVPNPRGVDAQRIKQAYLKSPRYRGPSGALTPEMLAKIEDKLPNKKQANWLAVSVWFGLRPEEIDQLVTHPEHHKIRNDGKFDILEVYQTKLVALEEEKKWKPIPVLFPEQKKLLKVIEARDLEQPLNVTLRKLTNDKVTCYGGRKGFIDLMLDRDQVFEEVSIWMGHQSIERSWRDYKNKQRVRYRAS